jgi:hypothetical protein
MKAFGVEMLRTSGTGKLGTNLSFLGIDVSRSSLSPLLAVRRHRRVAPSFILFCFVKGSGVLSSFQTSLCVKSDRPVVAIER